MEFGRSISRTSPFSYAVNAPTNAIDPDGKQIIFRLFYSEKDKKYVDLTYKSNNKMIRILAALWTLTLTFIFACTNESQREPNSFKLNKEMPQKSQIEIGKKVVKKNIINEFVLKDSNEVYFERMSFISIFGRTTEGKIFTGKIMWFKNYFDENLSTKGSFYYFLEDILINPQEEKK